MSSGGVSSFMDLSAGVSHFNGSIPTMSQLSIRE